MTEEQLPIGRRLRDRVLGGIVDGCVDVVGDEVKERGRSRLAEALERRRRGD